jgi:hypothetical protein
MTTVLEMSVLSAYERFGFWNFIVQAIYLLYGICTCKSWRAHSRFYEKKTQFAFLSGNDPSNVSIRLLSRSLITYYRPEWTRSIVKEQTQKVQKSETFTKHLPSTKHLPRYIQLLLPKALMSVRSTRSCPPVGSRTMG